MAVPMEWGQSPEWAEIYVRECGFFISFPTKPEKRVDEEGTSYHSLFIGDEGVMLFCAMWSGEANFSEDVAWEPRVEKIVEKAFGDRGKILKKEKVVYKGQKALRIVIEDRQAKEIMPEWGTAILEAYIFVMRGRLVMIFSVYEMRTKVVRQFFDSLKPVGVERIF
jgi:hypothetical protein